jgi:hypothetical protein
MQFNLINQAVIMAFIITINLTSIQTKMRKKFGGSVASNGWECGRLSFKASPTFGQGIFLQPPLERIL